MVLVCHAGFHRGRTGVTFLAFGETDVYRTEKWSIGSWYARLLAIISSSPGLSNAVRTSAAKKLVGLGYTDVSQLKGGIEAWVKAGYAMMQARSHRKDAKSAKNQPRPAEPLRTFACFVPLR